MSMGNRKATKKSHLERNLVAQYTQKNIPASFLLIPLESLQPSDQQHLEFFSSLPFAGAKSLEYVYSNNKDENGSLGSM